MKMYSVGKKKGNQGLNVKGKTNNNHIDHRVKKLQTAVFIYLNLVKLSQNPPKSVQNLYFYVLYI